MAKTQLQIVNRVLKRLREDTVGASTDNVYAGLIAEFVVDAVNAVSQEHNWASNNHILEFLSVAQQRDYVLSKNINNGGASANANPRLPTYRSRVAMSNNMPMAFEFDDEDDQVGARLRLISYMEQQRRAHQFTGTYVDHPGFFSLDTSTDEQLVLGFAEPPNAVRIYKVHFYTEIQDFESDGSTDSDTIYLPDIPVFWHAYMFALNERGEELGEPGNLAERRYLETLADAIHTDIKHDELTDVYDWIRG